eukprot:scaffold207653_cov35-Prasinocladus_malaysianus.AAC.1
MQHPPRTRSLFCKYAVMTTATAAQLSNFTPRTLAPRARCIKTVSIYSYRTRTRCEIEQHSIAIHFRTSCNRRLKCSTAAEATDPQRLSAQTTEHAACGLPHRFLPKVTNYKRIRHD